MTVIYKSNCLEKLHEQDKPTQWRQRIPEPGDLVLVRNHQVDNQRGRKLEARWLGPWLLVKWTSHRHSGWIRELHVTATPPRYHIDDIILYHERRPVFSGGILLTIDSSRDTNLILIISPDFHVVQNPRTRGEQHCK